MKRIQIDVMADSSEIVHYDSPGIPLYIRKGLLSYYPEKRAICHWHDDFEIILVLSGEINYYINGEILLLQNGDALFVNTREMHYGYSNHNHECEFICILFHPNLLSSNRMLFQDCISKLLFSSNISHIKLQPDHDSSTIDFIKRIYECKVLQNSFYEFEIIGLLYQFTAALLRIYGMSSMMKAKVISNDILALREMVSYIHENYNRTIRLIDIAASANICKSKCCSLFQEQISMTPFDFLNHFRLEKSVELLKSTTIPITSIALQCGFNNTSYYSKMFYRLYHCTPKEYRNQNHS